ncbi:hypothetical protein NQ176_g1651 [Zarea fungicola]|uniref:Uncharacterized protein n=1 Tax=Zarea fungicola TaxID=93591 RepID=A0ACC1NSE8_9HYPO|nr:hypothetical protein NQ176_g1651 [Lecanicillium fungicola]
MQIFCQLWPTKPEFTESDVPNLHGKVYLVTGSTSGIGRELARVLYSRNAVVYIAARSESKATAAIEAMRDECPNSTGSLHALTMDLADLKSVAAAASAFKSKETRLDVLFNNAGVMHPPRGSKTAQGYELQLGVNNLSHVLLTELLTPVLAETAAREKEAAVRVVWVSSLYAELSSPQHGFEPENMNYVKQDRGANFKYSSSKAGVYYQGTDYANKKRHLGIISIICNPGNLQTGLQRYESRCFKLAMSPFLSPAINGAYTELFCGLSPEVTIDRSGAYVIPWGQFAPIRSDLKDGSLSLDEGGTGMAEKWCSWCFEQIASFTT